MKQTTNKVRHSRNRKSGIKQRQSAKGADFKLTRKMKKFLVILVALVGFGISANAQNKVAFYKGDRHIVLYQDGSVGYWDGNKNYDGRWSNTGSIYAPTTNREYMGEYIKITVVESQNGTKLNWEGGIYYFNINTWKAIQGLGQQPAIKLGNEYFTQNGRGTR